LHAREDFLAPMKRRSVPMVLIVLGCWQGFPEVHASIRLFSANGFTSSRLIVYEGLRYKRLLLGIHASPSHAWIVQQGLIVKFEIVRHMVQDGHNMATRTTPVPPEHPILLPM